MRGKVALLISILLASTITLVQSVDAENKTHNVNIVLGSVGVENDRFYNPPIVKIKAGDSISWMNLGNDPHTVTDGILQSKWGNVFDSGLMRKGEEFRFKFTKMGDYPYLCALHPWMIGKVIVEDYTANSILSAEISILQKLNLLIKSEKQSYEQDEIIRFTVEVTAGNMPIDPDEIDSQFGAKESMSVTLSRIDVGKYVYSATKLEAGSYNLSLNVSKGNFAPAYSMLTIHVLNKDTVNEVPKPDKPLIFIESAQKQYYSGDIVMINGSASKITVDKSIVLEVFDAKNKLYTRGQVQVNTEGLFEWSFKVPGTAIEGTWTVRARNFDGQVITALEIMNQDSIETSVSKMEPLVSVPIMKFREEKITIVQSSITDQINSRLYGVSTAQSVVVQSLIKNNQETEQTFAYIAQIKDSNGVTVKLETVEGVLPAGKSFTVGVRWIPDKAESYTTEAFVWKSLNEPLPLALNLLNIAVDVD
ncbi:MAG: plastocyanin/azurin family copper-binding protein [Nitrososphaerales archaeon]